jgi:hypothetical protein
VADGTSNETLRQMLAGFNSMQSALGLLPAQSGSPSIGIGQATVPAPPMPMIPHPAEAAAVALQRHNEMTQQTLQAAQATRYQPPPSAPTPSSGGLGQFNPFVANALGGGGHGLPSPSALTPPAYGMFRPSPASGIMPFGGAARMPSIFNPLAPTLPSSHFATPAMRSLQVMQGHESQALGAMAGATEFGLGMAGAAAGGVLGSALGPLGTIAGSWLGGKLGHVAGGVMMGPAVQDAARARMIQNTTAPFMVTGSDLGPTGQGLSTGGALRAARGVRHMAHDLDFERTGFNTQDAMRIMGGAAQHGLLTGAQGPEEIVRRVKEISKSVKLLMQVTGDPDVRSALASLGTMRDLGFQGLGAQSGAVANRAMFARMAGVSQGAMHEAFGLPGAMMAQQVGLAGSTGYAAGMAGGGLANVAASAGSLNDLQLARAGGRSGLAQINAMAQISSMQSDVHLAASLRRGGKGLEVDMDAFRRAQGMTVHEVAKEAAERLHKIGAEGIFEWRTRRQEFKDQVAQKLTPLEMGMNVVRQAKGLQRDVPGMSLGSAIFASVQSNAVGAGMSEEQAEQAARSLELQFTDRKFWEGQKQQLRAQRRGAVDQQRARFGQFATQDFGDRADRLGQMGMLRASDSVSSPFQRASDRFRRIREDEEAAGYGEHVTRLSGAAIVGDDADRRMMHAAGGRGFDAAYGSGLGDDPLGRDQGPLGAAWSRQMNRMGSFVGLSGTSGANRMATLASESRGMFSTPFGIHPFKSFGNVTEAFERVQDVAAAGAAVQASDNFDLGKRRALIARMGTGSRGISAGSVLQSATTALVGRIDSLTASVLGAETGAALSQSDLKNAFIKGAADRGMNAQEAAKMFDANPGIAADMVKAVMSSGTAKQKEVLGKSVEIGTKLGAVNMTRTRDGLRDAVRNRLSAAGLNDQYASFNENGFRGGGYAASDKTISELGSTVAHHSQEEVAVAAALAAQASGDPGQRKKGDQALSALRTQLGDKRMDELTSTAQDTILKGASGDLKTALVRVASEGQAGNVTKRVGAVYDAIGMKKRGAATDALMSRLGSISSNKDVAGMADPLEAIRALSGSDLDRLEEDDPEMAKLLRAAAGGDQKAYEALLDGAAPSQRESRGGSRMSAIDKQMAKVDEMISATASDGDGVGLQAESSKLFADSVKTFADAVKDLKGSGEANNLAKGSPWFQSMIPGLGGSR